MSYPKYMVDKEKDGRFAIRKFTGFDHMWAEYSKPLEYFDTREEAEEYVKHTELESERKTSRKLANKNIERKQ